VKSDNLRNFTVRFLESALRRVESTAKPFYGGRLSTGEAIRRLAEERLDEIESKEAGERNRDALLRILSDWRAGRPLPIADLRLIADGANAAYQRCRADVVSRDLLIADVSAFREAVAIAARAKSGKGNELDTRYYLGNFSTSRGKIEAKSLAESVDKWIALLPDLTTPQQAEFASRNLLSFMRDEDCPDDTQLDRALRPYMSGLLQLAIRAHWYAERRPLLGPEEESQGSRVTHLGPFQHGRITLKPLVRDHVLALSLQLPDEHSVVTANNFVEVEDLVGVTRLALDGHDIRGEVFQWSKQLDEPRRFTLTTERGWWLLEAADVESVGQCFDSLFREPSVAALAERSRYIYGCI